MSGSPRSPVRGGFRAPAHMADAVRSAALPGKAKVGARKRIDVPQAISRAVDRQGLLRASCPSAGSTPCSPAIKKSLRHWRPLSKDRDRCAVSPRGTSVEEKISQSSQVRLETIRQPLKLPRSTSLSRKCTCPWQQLGEGASLTPSKALHFFIYNNNEKHQTARNFKMGTY